MGEQDLKITTFLKHLLKPRTIEETQEVYSEWAEKYDEVNKTFQLNFEFFNKYRNVISCDAHDSSRSSGGKSEREPMSSN
jgi:hypothetical protein